MNNGKEELSVCESTPEPSSKSGGEYGWDNKIDKRYMSIRRTCGRLRAKHSPLKGFQSRFVIRVVIGITNLGSSEKVKKVGLTRYLAVPRGPRFGQR